MKYSNHTAEDSHSLCSVIILIEKASLWHLIIVPRRRRGTNKLRVMARIPSIKNKRAVIRDHLPLCDCIYTYLLIQRHTVKACASGCTRCLAQSLASFLCQRELVYKITILNRYWKQLQEFIIANVNNTTFNKDKGVFIQYLSYRPAHVNHNHFLPSL